MSEKMKRGWVWSLEEKDWTKTVQRKLRGPHRNIVRDLDQFKKAVPEYSQEAIVSARPLMETLELLLDIDGRRSGRKYQPISFDEAQMKLKEVARYTACWNEFTAKPEIQKAISIANKDARKKARMQKKSTQRFTEVKEHLLQKPEFREIAKGWADYVKKQSKDTAQLAGALNSFGEPSDIPILQKLTIIAFIRTTYCFEVTRKRKNEVQGYLDKEDSVSLDGLLEFVLFLLIRDSIEPDFQDSKPDLTRIIDRHFEYAFKDLMLSCKQWSRAGLKIAEVDEGHFTVLGHEV